MFLFRRKPLDQLLGETTEPNRQLKRVLGPIQLTALGVGASVGAGIFSSIGSAVAGGSEHVGAGPAIIVSFLLVAVACALAGFCYAEFAAMVPTSGSAYTYAYVTLGELLAWIIGWDLILEYAVGNVAVAVSWSGYFVDFLAGLGVHLPLWMTSTVDQARASPEILAHAPHIGSLAIVMNLPAGLIVAALTWLLVVG